MRRVIVTGSRDWVARIPIWNALYSEITQYPEGIIVVHGGAEGADGIADRWAWGMHRVGHNVRPEVHKPDYEQYSPIRAPLVRNRKMAELGAAVCHAFPIEGGTGTRHMMTRCFAAGIPVVNHGFQPYTRAAREFAEAYG